MKILLLAAGGRAGADFFHSLLDDHSQILQFPGYLRVNKLASIFNYDSSDKIAKAFIKSYPEFFDSRYEKFERWHRLGPNKNRFFKINKKKFINSFVNISNIQKNYSRIKIIENLHKAYFVAKGKKIRKNKILFIHTHLLSWTRLFINLTQLKKFEIIHTIRHPLASINSPLKTWLSYENGSNFFSKDLYYQLDTVCNCISDLKKLNKVHIIQLEKLHLDNLKVMKNFCEKFNLKYEKCLSRSTKNSLKWWGDVASKKWLSGTNKNFKLSIEEKYFYSRDLIFFQFLTENIIKKYNYDFFFEKKKIYLNYLPMKCEILVWKNTFKHLFYKGFRWKHLISIPFFYFKRILLLNKFFVGESEKFLPNSIK